jgi:hypothetical protein
MILGLTVTMVMLIVIAILGTLGYLMDRQVDHDDKENNHPA